MGTTNIQKLYDKLIESLTRGIDIFGDGFQFSDLFQIVGLGKSVFDVMGYIPDAKEEAMDLDENEVDHLIGDFVEKALALFDIGNGGTEYGTDNFKDFIEDLGRLAITAEAALRDGLNIDDVVYLPEATKAVGGLIITFPEMLKEAGDLNRAEMADLLGDLAKCIMKVIK